MSPSHCGVGGVAALGRVVGGVAVGVGAVPEVGVVGEGEVPLVGVLGVEADVAAVEVGLLEVGVGVGVGAEVEPGVGPAVELEPSSTPTAVVVTAEAGSPSGCEHTRVTVPAMASSSAAMPVSTAASGFAFSVNRPRCRPPRGPRPSEPLVTSTPAHECLDCAQG